MATNKFTGLSSKQVEENKAKYGDNSLSVKQSATFLEMFLESFKDPWIIILLLALGVKFLINIATIFFPILGEPNWYEVGSLLIAILLSTVVSTVSAYKNEQAFNALQAEASNTTVKVYRDGKLQEILVNDITKDDFILLQSGDKVPVDGIVLEGSCKVNQAALNGESEDASKVVLPKNEPIPDSSDLLNKHKIFRGSVVTSGEVVIKAVDLGDNSILGTINTSLQEESKPSPSDEKLERLAKQIGFMGYSSAAVYSIITFILQIIETWGSSNFWAPLGLAIIEILMYAVTIVIMAVPEGLPMMMSLVSAMNSKRLQKEYILVRNPKSIETAGYVNVIFSDKTGTITGGVLELVEFITGNSKIFNVTGDETKSQFSEVNDTLKTEIINGIGLNNDSNVSDDGRAVGSNNTDRALLNYLIQSKQLDFNRDSIIEKEEFNSALKFATVTTEDGTKYIKGAPEFILKDVKYYIDENGVKQEFTQADRDKFEALSIEQASRSMRILAVLKQEKDSDEKTFVSAVCIRDNVRKGIDKTVSVLNKAGVQVVMVTGDRKETAVAIAKEAGIIKDETKDVVLTHDELEALSDKELKDIIPNLKVVSRALPLDKKRLVNIAQELELVVGMTGDGVNDAPALKSADVGFSMGDGTEVAKEASDIVILNNSLSSIEKAVLYGRTMTKSVKKFIIFQLTVNVSTIATSLIGPLTGIHEPFNIIQILWVNLIMDTLAALAFGKEPALESYMNELPVPRKAPILDDYMKSSIGTAGLFITSVCVMIMTNFMNIQSVISPTGDKAVIQTFMFTVFIYSIIFNSLNTRSEGFDLFNHIKSNTMFIWVMTSIAIFQSLIIQFGGKVFGTVPMDLEHFGLALLIAILIIPIDFIRKAIISNK